VVRQFRYVLACAEVVAAVRTRGYGVEPVYQPDGTLHYYRVPDTTLGITSEEQDKHPTPGDLLAVPRRHVFVRMLPDPARYELVHHAPSRKLYLQLWQETGERAT
jgi:hypothetical protein